jgi:hypothetical protein
MLRASEPPVGFPPTSFSGLFRTILTQHIPPRPDSAYNMSSMAERINAEVIPRLYWQGFLRIIHAVGGFEENLVRPLKIPSRHIRNISERPLFVNPFLEFLIKTAIIIFRNRFTQTTFGPEISSYPWNRKMFGKYKNV